MIPKQYIYHSFPRRRQRSRKSNCQKAEEILAGILEHGLLLTPELITWVEQKPYPTQPRNFSYIQHRVCFTELPRSALKRHSRSFGEYAIEFTIPSARRLGAIPIFYIPTASPPDGFSALGATMMHRMKEIIDLLLNLHEVQSLKRPKLGEMLSKNGEPLQCRIADARAFVQSLFADRVSPTGLLSFLDAFLSHFYPTENLRYNEPLGYYQQREWRICGRLNKDGVSVVTEATALLRAKLMALDGEFFGKRIQYEGRFDTIAEMSFTYKELDSRHVLSHANAVICPSDRTKAVRKLLTSNGIDVRVIGLDSVCRSRTTPST